MTSVGRLAQCTSLLVLLSCGGSGGQGGTPVGQKLSQGLKISVTARTHPADFANDPYLNGNAIQKADDFCNTDPNKPAPGTYKALIVDGVLRDAKTRTDWVLQPNTTYFRTHDDVEIGTTTSASTFGAAYKPLTNAVDPPPSGAPGEMGSWKWVWTGISSAIDFAADGDTCSAWSNMTTSIGWTGVAHFADQNAFANTRWSCANAWNHLYCVQQP